jgi:hypothetical protein
MEDSNSDDDADDHTSEATDGEQPELGKASDINVNIPNSPTHRQTEALGE